MIHLLALNIILTKIVLVIYKTLYIVKNYTNLIFGFKFVGWNTIIG